MTSLAQFRTRVSTKLGLDNTTGGDQGSIDAWVNEGVEQVLLDTNCYVTSQTVTPGASADYTLPVGVLEMVDLYVTSGGQGYPLTRISVPDMLAMRRVGSGAASPAQYYALAGQNTILWFPTPAAADTVTMYYVPVPTALSASADDPSAAANGGIPAQFHKAIEYWACAEGGDYDDDQSSSQGQRYRDLYQQQISKLRRYLNAKGGARQPRARVARRQLVPHDRSTY